MLLLQNIFAVSLRNYLFSSYTLFRAIFFTSSSSPTLASSVYWIEALPSFFHSFNLPTWIECRLSEHRNTNTPTRGRRRSLSLICCTYYRPEWVCMCAYNSRKDGCLVRKKWLQEVFYETLSLIYTYIFLVRWLVGCVSISVTSTTTLPSSVCT